MCAFKNAPVSGKAPAQTSELTTPEQEALLKPLLQAHLEATGSAKAAAILADWPSWKGRFKLLVPPSEKANVGLAEREAVAV